MANSKVKKGLLYYLFILLLIVLGIFCIFSAILIFNPGKDVFGINVRYVSHKKQIEYYKLTNSDTLIENSVYENVTFNSGYTNFIIEYSEDEVNTKIVFNPKVSALSKNENTNFDIKIEIVDKTLNITVTEPELWIGFSKKADVKFICPRNKNLKNNAFDITTTSGSVTLGDNTHQFVMKDLNIKTETGNVTIYNNVDTVSHNANIITKKSSIYVLSELTGTLSIENEKGRIYTPNFKGSLKITNTGTLELNGDEIAGDVLIKSKNGYVNVKTIKGNFTTFDNVENTNIIIKDLQGDIAVTTSAGYIDIEKVGNQALIETDSGSVKIGSISKKTDISTKSGAITVTQKGAAKTTLNTEKGKITANFVEVLMAEINSEWSDININIATGKVFKLNYTTKYGIQASWITTDLENNGTILVSGADEFCTNVITANSENGKIIIKDGFTV